MSDRILVPVDGSPLSEKALEHVLEKHPDAEVTVICVIDPVDAVYAAEGEGPIVGEQWYEGAKDRADRACQDARDIAEERGKEIDSAVEVGKPATQIVEYAEDHEVDHVVMGSHGRKGLSRILLGSVAEGVMRRASMPVTIIR